MATRPAIRWWAPVRTPFDLSGSKEFRVREGQKVLFRTELFNAFNTPQFANPVSTLGSGSFGRVTGTAGDNRVIQFALKYLF